MTNTTLTTNPSAPALKILSWMFGIAVLFAALINIFWGNDPWFGAMLFVLSLVYFPPANLMLRKTTGFSIHFIIKILLAICIVLAALGVGELFNKIELMQADLFNH